MSDVGNNTELDTGTILLEEYMHVLFRHETRYCDAGKINAHCTQCARRSQLISSENKREKHPFSSLLLCIEYRISYERYRI